MNVKKMLAVADAIERENIGGKPYAFNMRLWYARMRTMNSHGETCGTMACVAGTAVLMYAADRRLTKEEYLSEGARILGLTDGEAKHLFLGRSVERVFPFSLFSSSPDEISLYTINSYRHLVPDALRWMAITGVVDWHRALDAARCVADQRLMSPGTSEPEIVTA